MTMNLDPEAVEAAITPRTRAILPVHFAGRPCDMAALTAIAARNELRLIEDCAHAIETQIDGKHAGTFGDAGCFSFYVTKNMVTGEGGMLVTDDAEIAARAKILSLHGMDRDAWHRFGDKGYKHYAVVTAGFKYNMMDIQAAMGIHQLERVEQSLLRREAVWQAYDEAFSDLDCMLPAARQSGTRHARHLYTLLLDTDRLGKDRDAVIDELTAQNIGVGVHYIGLHLHPYYQQMMGVGPRDFPHATQISERTLSLPLSAKLTDDDVLDVIQAVRFALEAKQPLSRAS
jgi:dTDP-4-amino-4,6-dideoxygalactose transaminase